LPGTPSAESTPAPLWERWDALAPRLATGTLLAAFDYDGTLVPIRPTPEEAIADTATRGAVARLASTPGTSVAVVSGRPVAQLRDLLDADGLWLVGLHGLEVAAPHGEMLPAIDLAAAAAALAPLRSQATAIAARHPGTRIEDKGVSLVLHTRQAARPTATAAVAEMRAAASSLAGFELLAGKETLEARPAGVDKGTAMLRVWRDAGGATALYVGDDTTDEDAFAALAGNGAVTVRVGDEGLTCASHVLRAQEEVAELLARLLALRSS
jgi:trehalose 6-phosphate phosphatase